MKKHLFLTVLLFSLFSLGFGQQSEAMDFFLKLDGREAVYKKNMQLSEQGKVEISNGKLTIAKLIWQYKEKEGGTIILVPENHSGPALNLPPCSNYATGMKSEQVPKRKPAIIPFHTIWHNYSLQFN